MSEVNPQWVRETLCEDRAELYRDSGMMPDTREIESTVDADIRLFQAQERINRDKGIAPPKRVEPIAQPKTVTRDGLDKTDPAGDLAERLNWKLKRGDELRTPTGQRQRCLCGACKVCKLAIRLSVLTQLRPGYRPKQKDFFFPQYANDIVWHYVAHKRLKGPYAGLSMQDAGRAFSRAMEDICDRSTKELGNWWVK